MDPAIVGPESVGRAPDGATWYALVDDVTGEAISVGTVRDEERPGATFVRLDHEPDFTHEAWDATTRALVPREPPPYA